MYGKFRVSLRKRSGVNLGLTVSGGLDRGEPPTIADIRQNSDADKSDSLLIGDYILAINGTSTMNLRHEQIVQLAKASKSQIILDLQYELPEYPILDCRSEKCIIELDKIRDENFGMIIRGGWAKNPSQIRPLTIMSIRPNSSADLNGAVKPGDRILAINNTSTDRYTCQEITRKLRKMQSPLKLLIEYNIANVDEGRNVPCSVIVEIEKMPMEKLGISLRCINDPSKITDDSHEKIYLIDYIKPASIADRCGALKIGDMIEAIDGMPIQNVTLEQAMNRIRLNRQESIRIQIVPNYSQKLKAYRDQMAETISQKSNKSSLYSINQNSSFSGLSEDDEKYSSNFDINGAYSDDARDNSMDDQCSCQSHDSCNERMNAQKVTTVSLDGFGQRRRKMYSKKSSRKSSFTSNSEFMKNSSIESSSCFSSLSGSETEINKRPKKKGPISCPASPNQNRSNFHHELSISSVPGKSSGRKSKSKQSLASSNHGSKRNLRKDHSVKQSLTNVNKTLTESHSKLSYTKGLCSFDEITLQLVPRQETTQQALISNYPIFGFVISYSYPTYLETKEMMDQPLKDYPIISDILEGGLAHQSGVIQEGDTLIAINDNVTIGKSINEIMKSYLNPTVYKEQEPISLTLQYRIANSVVPERGRFTIKLVKKFPSLGINLQTPIPGNVKGPLLISKVIPGSVANRSGVISSGDRLLAVNRVSLDTCSLNQAIALLQFPNDEIVELRLEKAQQKTRENIDPDLKGNNNLLLPLSKSSSRQNTTEEDDFKTVENELKIEKGYKLIRVILRRESPLKPWGIIISGTDDKKDNPITVDSLTPNEPAELSGDIQPGDRILAINGVNIQHGFTLSQAMERLQQYKHHVVLHITRKPRPPTSKKPLDLAFIKNSHLYQSFSKSLDYNSATNPSSPMMNGSRENSFLTQQANVESGKVSKRSQGRYRSAQHAPESSINSESFTGSSHPDSGQAPSTVVFNPKSQDPDKQKHFDVSNKEIKVIQTSAPLAMYRQNSNSQLNGNQRSRHQSSSSYRNKDFIEEDHLEKIQCAGCRETIESEIKERLLMKKRSKEYKKPLEQMHRERSLPRSFEKASMQKVKSPERSKVRSIPTENSSIKHSKSDTRLNKEKAQMRLKKKHAKDEMNDGSMTAYQSRTLPTKKPDTTSLKKAKPPGLEASKPQKKVEIWIKLSKASPYESYGIGVSEGLVTRGIFVSAIRPNSPAEKSGKIQLYDKIIQINKVKVAGLSCSQVVSLIGKSDLSINILVQRIKK